MFDVRDIFCNNTQNSSKDIKHPMLSHAVNPVSHGPSWLDTLKKGFHTQVWHISPLVAQKEKH